MKKIVLTGLLLIILVTIKGIELVFTLSLIHSSKMNIVNTHIIDIKTISNFFFIKPAHFQIRIY